VIEDQRIAIIGGTGKFGKHLGELLEGGNKIVISGSSVEKAEETANEHGWEYGENSEIVKDADIVIVSVPISITERIIEDIGPSVPEDALLSDVTSVKQKPCKAMEKHSSEVAGMHPMYAPSNSPEGQNVVICPIKGKKWTVMEEFWTEHGAEVHIAEPEQHDRAMSIVQGLTHFTELVFAETLNRLEYPEEETEKFATPVYRIVSDLTARMLNQQPELYGSIQTENPENSEVREKFNESAEEMLEMLETSEGFEERFEELDENFDLEKAQGRTDKLIELFFSADR